MARNDRLQLKQVDQSNMVSMSGTREWGVFREVFRVVNGDRAVVIILDSHCVRWMGYARGIELTYLGKKPATGWNQAALPIAKMPREIDSNAMGWTAVNGRHEFYDADRDKCIRNALRWVNKTAAWIYAR